MTIQEFIAVCKSKEAYIVVLIFVVGFASFGLGRLSRVYSERAPVSIESPVTAPVVLSQSVSANALSALRQTDTGGKVVASKNGGKYHFPWCSGAERISEANKIWFNSIEEARKAGYLPASNCKGLK